MTWKGVKKMKEVKPDAYYAFKDWLRLIDDGWPVANATNNNILDKT